MKNSEGNKNADVLLDLVLKGSDHQNYVNLHILALKNLMQKPSMLGPSLDSFAAIAAMDEILPAFFLGSKVIGDRCSSHHQGAGAATATATGAGAAAPAPSVPAVEVAPSAEEARAASATSAVGADTATAITSITTVGGGAGASAAEARSEESSALQPRSQQHADVTRLIDVCCHASSSNSSSSSCKGLSASSVVFIKNHFMHASALKSTQIDAVVFDRVLKYAEDNPTERK
jgi:hypothetical protein